MLVLDDYFEVEPHIIGQIETLKPEHFKHVSPALNLDQVLDYSGKFPAAFVIFNSHSIRSATRNVLQEQQTWMIAVAAKDVSDTDFNAGVRRKAGPLLYQIDRALHGFGFESSTGSASVLKAVSPPESFQNVPGYGIFIRAFELDFVNSGNR